MSGISPYLGQGKTNLDCKSQLTFRVLYVIYKIHKKKDCKIDGSGSGYRDMVCMTTFACHEIHPNDPNVYLV